LGGCIRKRCLAAKLRFAGVLNRAISRQADGDRKLHRSRKARATQSVAAKQMRPMFVMRRSMNVAAAVFAVPGAVQRPVDEPGH
jgi:hypothetical protein